MPGIHRDPYDRMMHGRFATIEKILHDVDDKLYFAVALEGEGQDLLRETGRHTFFFEGEVEPAVSERTPQVLVAGVGNAWLTDDGFGPRWSSAWRRCGRPREWRCSTSAAAAWTWPTRSCAATTRW